MTFLAVLLATQMATATTMGQEPLQILDTQPQPAKIENTGYAIGREIGRNLAAGGVEIGDFVKEELLRGICDVLEGKESALSDEQLQAVMQAFAQKLQARQVEKAKVKLDEANKFLEENKTKEGVKVTQSGLQYKVLQSGNGASPVATNRVTVHYEGKLLNGKVFDSSIQRGQPATFVTSQVIPGWVEALQKMKVGDKWVLYIPPGLAYGERGNPAIGPNELLIFEVELLEVK